ncbi:MAG: PorT family protein [Tannerellaceae bacterium]|nr:PorT family protein [Tannerellaceae bacterium]
MSDNKEADRPFDRFSEYMQRRFEDHRIPVDGDGWKEVEARMQRRHTPTLRKAALWIAAAVLLLLSLLTFPWKRAEVLPEASPDLFTGQAETKEEEKREDHTPPVPVLSVVKAERPVAGLPDDTPVDVAQEGDAEAGTPEEKKEENSAVYTAGHPVISLDNSWDEPKPVRAKKGKQWLIAAAFGSGGGIPSGDWGIENDPVYDSPPLLGSDKMTNAPVLPPEYGYILPGDFSDITYTIPLSFGITVRKNLGQRWAVESGLMYTYLLTKFKKQEPTYYEAGLELHYIGIPLHLVAYMWNDTKWTVYGSVGGMGEKGLRAVYTQHQYRPDVIVTSTVKTSIRKMQWSLSGSIGASYRFYKAWSIYAEPRLSYYFKSEQPMSTRTEHPVCVELGIGLRYAF